MKAMGVRVAFLPLGVQGDLVKRPELRPVIIERLKRLAPAAEESKLVLGLETALHAEAEAELLDEIGSPSVRSYFNLANALQAGRCVCAELRTLGKDRVCQIPCTDEDGVWLEHNERLDLKAVKQTLKELEWSGWLVVERSRDANDPRKRAAKFRRQRGVPEIGIPIRLSRHFPGWRPSRWFRSDVRATGSHCRLSRARVARG